MEDKAPWIEHVFSKRECCHFVPSTKDSHRCACGQTWHYHKGRKIDNIAEPGEVWNPARHTVSSPTDAYGTIDFLGGPHPNKAQYIRLAFDSRSDYILHLLNREWALELPKLIISVHGGKANFELNTRLKKVLRKGLLRAAKTTGAWIFTGGTNTGVTRHVGDALISERSPRLRGGRVVSIGIPPWGVVENRAALIGRKKDVPYMSIDQPRSKFAVLNNRHAYFLLVDNGTVGRYGAEIALRRKLEKYISSQRIPTRTHCSIPVVCLVIEGGMHTIRTVLEYVTDSPPVPVVVCEGSGRAADLLAFVYKYAPETGEASPVIKDQLMTTIQRTFNVDVAQAEKLYLELVQCVRKKNLITIFRVSDSDQSGEGQDLDQAILSALFRSRHLSAAEQLSLALTWNRVDIAQSEVFVYGQEWPEGALEEAMMDALVKNRVDFVKLLLENGVQMSKFLTIPRMEELYNSNQGPVNTLRYIVRDVRPNMPRNYLYTLLDIGLVINKLMGGAYRSSYTRRKFRSLYQTVTKRPVGSLNQSSIMRVYSNHVFRNGNMSLQDDSGCGLELSGCIFKHPFNELLVWAVLTKRQAMAHLMWQHGEEALVKSLIACQLYRAMAREAADDDLEMEIYEELRKLATEFETLALELLDFCYRQDEQLAQQLLTCELPNWSRQTCLGLAFACNHRRLLAHPCAQLILADLWMGGLRTRRSTNLKVIISLLIPPVILRLEFKSKEELQLMPQTEEEHLIDLREDRSEDGDTSSSSSSTSSPSNSSSERSLSQRASVVENSNNDNLSVITRQEKNSSKENVNGEVNDYVFYDRSRRSKQLRFKKKLYEFYAAPITKFWGHSMAYMAFLMIYTYTMLVRLPDYVAWNEGYIIAYIASFGGEKIREILASEPVKLSHKVSVWANSWWNICDSVAVLEFFVGMSLRLNDEFKQHGRVLYCLNIVFWYIRILRILSVSKFLGPFVTMMGKMVKNMIYFVTLLAVVLMAYGVFRQSLLFPNEEPSWRLARDIFFQPYFMIYGEVFADEIDPPCGGEGEVECVTGRWLNPLLMASFLLMANILLINLLIAVFNSIFLRTNVNSHQIWKFNRFSVVMEYEQKPVLPPPLISLAHLYLIGKWWRRRAKGMKESYDHGLKLFLDDDDLERLYDFEEECMEGLAREKDNKVQQSTDDRIRVISERVDGLSLKVEDCFQKSLQQTQALQSLRLRLEETAEQTNANLSLMNRYLIFHTRTVDDDPTKSSMNLDIGSLSPEDFGKHLALPGFGLGRRSSCAMDSRGELDTPDENRIIDPQDLAMLQAMGPVKVMRNAERACSDTSQDGVKIMQAMEESAMRDLDQIERDDEDSSSGSSTPKGSRKSFDTTTPSVGKEEYPDVFHSDHVYTESSCDEEGAHAADPKNPSPAHRSYSVGGKSELRKRFRNWSGSVTTSAGNSPKNLSKQSGGRAAAASQVVEENSEDVPDEPKKNLKLHVINSCPAGHKTGGLAGMASCPSCQLIRTSLSYGSFNAAAVVQQQPQRILAGELESVVGFAGALPRSLSAGGRSQNKPKVEAEAEHLRELEGQDYHMMEGIIRRRLHRDSENLDISLEDLCNAPLKDESLDSVDEAPEIVEEHAAAANFVIGGAAMESDTENSDVEAARSPSGLSVAMLAASTIKIAAQASYSSARRPSLRRSLKRKTKSPAQDMPLAEAQTTSTNENKTLQVEITGATDVCVRYENEESV